MASNSKETRASLSCLIDGLGKARCPLTALDLSHNALLEEGPLVRLVSALRLLTPALRALQLDGCNVSPRVTVALCSMLREAPWACRLQRLTLAHNHIGREEGSVALSAALRCSAALVELDLTHTQVAWT